LGGMGPYYLFKKPTSNETLLSSLKRGLLAILGLLGGAPCEHVNIKGVKIAR